MDQDIKGKGMKSDETAHSVDHGKDWVVDGLGLTVGLGDDAGLEDEGETD